MTKLVETSPILILFLFVYLSCALQVTPGSSCASVCLDNSDGDPLNSDDSTTEPTDIVCSDINYWSNTTGIKFRNCINCLQDSTAVNGTENDVDWYLYNLRYALDVCLFSFPNTSTVDATAGSSTCSLDSVCLPLKTALETGDLDAGEAEFQYCSEDEALNSTNIQNCIECLQATSEQVYLANFLTALTAGCQQEPAAGELLGINGTLFSETLITFAANETATSSTANSALSNGAIGGIAVGVLFLLMLAALLFYIYWKKQQYPSIYDEDDWRADGPYGMKGGGNLISEPLHTSPDFPEQHFRDAQYGTEMYTQNLPLRTMTAEREIRASRLFFGLSHRRPAPVPPIQIPEATKSNWANMDSNSSQNQNQNPQGLPAHPAYIAKALARPIRNPDGSQEPVRQRPANRASMGPGPVAQQSPEADANAAERWYLEATENSPQAAVAAATAAAASVVAASQQQQQQQQQPSSSRFSPRSLFSTRTSRTASTGTTTCSIIISPPPGATMSHAAGSPPPGPVSSPPMPPARSSTPPRGLAALRRSRKSKKFKPSKPPKGRLRETPIRDQDDIFG